MNQELSREDAVQEGLKEYSDKNVDTNMSKQTEIGGVKIHNENQLPQEVVDEVLRMAKEQEFNRVEIGSYEESDGIQIIFQDEKDRSTYSSISPRKIKEWLEEGVLEN